MKFLHATLAAVCLAGPALAQPPEDAAADAVEPAIEHALLTGNAKELPAVIAQIEAGLAKQPNNPGLLYERAFADYAKTSALRAAQDNSALDEQLDRAAKRLAHVRGQPWEAEAQGLAGAIDGELIGVRGPMSGMMLGPKSAELQGRAEKEIPASPRILLYRGITLLNTPKLYGGDPAKAVQILQSSADSFAGTAIYPGPHWGHAMALAWLGAARQKTGDDAGARAAWNQALEIEPNYAWVKFVLLPSLGQKSAS